MLQQQSMLRVCGGVGSVSIQFGLEPSSGRMRSEILSAKDTWEKEGFSLPTFFLRAELSARKLPHASASSGCHRGSSCCHQAPPLLPLQPLEFEEDNLHC